MPMFDPYFNFLFSIGFDALLVNVRRTRLNIPSFFFEKRRLLIARPCSSNSFEVNLLCASSACYLSSITSYSNHFSYYSKNFSISIYFSIFN
jgi:hypothetical protein